LIEFLSGRAQVLPYIFMKVLIVVNAYIKNASQLSQAERIDGELSALGAAVEVKRNFNLAEISGNRVSAEKYGFCVYLDKDRVAARLLEKSGLRLFNTAAAIEVCDDKMLTNTALAGLGFNVPDCIYAPLCYNADSIPDSGFLNGVAKRLGFPLVAKSNYGSLGAGVELVADKEQLYKYEERNLLSPHFYQKLIDCGCGRDTRVLVIGGRAVCAMDRINESDFRSNIELGGRGEKAELDGVLADMCVGVANCLGLDYCGIDVLTGKDGARYICEVNSNAFFAAAERVCGVNVAKAYAQYMLKKMG